MSEAASIARLCRHPTPLPDDTSAGGSDAKTVVRITKETPT
ncbi:hypothetical protein J2W42_002963 [Rhizobium tibeticum]|nr:hypothetical protein [Rhizobium tibeticum]